MTIEWLRLWHDMPTDPKWRVISNRCQRPISEVMAVFTFMMVNASANATERGRTHNLFADDIGAALGLEEQVIHSIILAMEGKVISGDKLLGWEKRQPKREDNSADRARKWRQEKAERNRTQSNATERPDTDSDTEKKVKEIKHKDVLQRKPKTGENSNGKNYNRAEAAHAYAAAGVARVFGKTSED